MTNDYAIVIAGHGSKDPEGVLEFEQLANLVRQQPGSPGGPDVAAVLFRVRQCAVEQGHNYAQEAEVAPAWQMLKR